MRKKFLLMFLAVFPALCWAQTVFGYAIDTLFLSAGDSTTVVQNKSHVFSVGDTLKAWFWSGSDDSIQWFPMSAVTGDSCMVDTLPRYRFYAAVIQGGMPDYIVWKVGTVAYKRLRPPDISNNAFVNKTNILLVRHDSIQLFATFDGLQPDSVKWFRNGFDVGMPVYVKGGYHAVGYIYNRYGKLIDKAVSEVVNIDFVYPLHSVIFRSWAGSNDGKPRVIDTLLIDTCIKEYIIDTLVFAVGDGYKYQFVPVIHVFDKPYNFTYKWEYSGFATVNQVDSVLEFNPIGFEHTGSYRFVTTRQLTNRTWISYLAAPFRIVAYNTPNEQLSKQSSVIVGGVVYDMFGRIVRTNVAGEYNDVINRLQIPKGVYFLRDKDKTYKFIKN